MFYEGIVLWLLYYERGYYKSKKRNLHRLTCRLHSFILLDNKNKFLWWMYPTLGEEHIFVSLLYCVSYVFYFSICFILFLHDPIFLIVERSSVHLVLERNTL
jgi:hypothetical protein